MSNMPPTPSLISVAQLERLKAAIDELIILDASPATNKSGLQTAHPGLQIPGARPADLKAQFSDLKSPWPNTVPSPQDFSRSAQQLGIKEDSRVVIYDNLGIYSAPRLWWLFSIMGHKRVSVLDGGLPAWVDAGLATEAIPEKEVYSPGTFTAELDSSAVWDRNQVEANVKQPTALVLDARSAGRFEGSSPEPRIGLPSGHIPASCSLPFKEVLRDGRMKTKEELQTIFAGLGVGEEPLVFSCGSGLTACITLLAADQVLDRPLAVFDGSWTEWAGDIEQVRLIELGEKKLLGISRMTTMADPSAAVLWRQFSPRIKEVKELVTDYRFSLQQYPVDMFATADPRGVPYQQWAAMEVSSFENQAEDLGQLLFPAGLYAVHLHRGTPADFPKTFQRIFAQWLPQSGYQLDDRPHFERLAPDYRPNDPNAVEEIWIPIKK